MAITEIASLVLKPGVDIDADGSNAFAAWTETLTTLAQQPGYIESRWGMTLEEPELLVWCLDWDSVAAHQAFMASPAYAPFVARLTPLLAAAPVLFHCAPAHGSGILSTAPVIEYAVFHGVTAAFAAQAAEFQRVALDAAPRPDRYYGASLGPVVEALKRDADAPPKPAYVALIGWESVEAHMAFRTAERFKEYVHLLRTGNDGAKVLHVAFKSRQVEA